MNRFDCNTCLYYVIGSQMNGGGGGGRPEPSSSLILLFLGCISENAIFMQFYVILPDISATGLKCFNEITGDLPVVSTND